MNFYQHLAFLFLTTWQQCLGVNFSEITLEKYFKATALQQETFCLRIETFFEKSSALRIQDCEEKTFLLELEFACLVFEDLDRQLGLHKADEDQIKEFINFYEKEDLIELVLNKVTSPDSLNYLNNVFKSTRWPFFLEDYFSSQWLQGTLNFKQRLKAMHFISRVLYRYYLLASMIEEQLELGVEAIFSFLYSSCWPEVIKLAFYLEFLKYSRENLDEEKSLKCYQKIINIFKKILCTQSHGHENNLITQVHFYQIIFDDELYLLSLFSGKNIDFKKVNRKRPNLPHLDLNKLNDVSQEVLNSGNSLGIPNSNSIPSPRRFSINSTDFSSDKSSIPKSVSNPLSVASFPTPTALGLTKTWSVVSLNGAKKDEEAEKYDPDKSPLCLPLI